MASGTILVVEDNPLNRELVVDILEAADYTMLQAEDGMRLLEQVKDERPDLIILDLQLPGVDGLSLARQLKADPATQSIPILAMSTHAMREVQAQARAAGCAGFVTKPLDTQEFVLTIARALGQ